MRKTPILLAAVLALTSATAALGGEPARPMAEMHGDCSNYLTDISRDLTLWDKTPVTLSAGATGSEATAAPLEMRLRIALKSHPQVRFAAPPEQMRGTPEKFSGLISIRTGAAGAYRLSAGDGLWLDVVGPAGLVPSRAFEMQTKCDRIFKTVTYELPADTHLIVQLNGGAAPETNLLAHRIEQ